MIRRILSILLMLMPLVLLAENMSVESFKRLDNDMDARMFHPEKDPSGRTCAIIKVVNPNTGFVFDTGSVSVIKTKQGTGEIWVYVQPGAKKLTVNHPTLGVMRDYYFPMAIEEATVYELLLASDPNHNNKGPKPIPAFLVVNSTPEGADVYIGGKWVGQTPFNKKYIQGQTLQYRISRALYHDEVGEVNIDKSRTEVNAQLKPAYGSISVTSEPKGASVVLDNETESRGTTPLTIDKVASGSHSVRVQLPRYGQKVFDVTVTDGGTAQANANLTASFATITVNTLPGATIKADGNVKGIGSATWEQDAGMCDIEVSLKGHRSQSSQIQLTQGESQSISLEPKPMYGILVVESDPAGADIYLDGVKHGITPDVLDRVLAMEHTVKLSKAGCADYITEVTVRENEETTAGGKLSMGETVTFTTGQNGDDIYVDGKFVGKSPLTSTVTYGNHTAYAIREDKRSAEKGFEVRTGQKPSVNLVLEESGEYTVKGVKFRMIPVEGGTFIMGTTTKLANGADKNETPSHEVTLSDYMIGQTEVTQALWEAVMGNNPSSHKGENLPVENVSWNECQNFIKKINQLTELDFRLPTEAEWEYAAKGGKYSQGFLYSGSNKIGSVAWYSDNSWVNTHPVATKVPNELGIYDMSGNVREWCKDSYGYYSSSPQINPIGGPASGPNCVYRGGCMIDDLRNCRSTSRSYCSPSKGNKYLGFRLALTP